jgi:hypothetical protein
MLVWNIIVLIAAVVTLVDVLIRLFVGRSYSLVKGFGLLARPRSLRHSCVFLILSRSRLSAYSSGTVRFTQSLMAGVSGAAELPSLWGLVLVSVVGVVVPN